MVLEATMIVIDNSEYMRNGDYTPTRFSAQIDSVNLIFQAKTQSNPESTVGIMTMGGDTPEVKATPTSDFGKILAGIHEVSVHGSSHLSTAIQIAALALKHRQNKVQRQRVIVFVGSPIEEDSKSLVKLAKRMKKNNVAVDFVNFGQETDNTDKLDQFIEGVNSNDNSHLVTVPPGRNLLSDVLASSPIINEDREAGFSASNSGNSASNDTFEFGVDPSVDPELALALRMSLEDEKARQEKEKQEKEKEQSNGTGTESGASGSGSGGNKKPEEEDQEMN